MASLNPLNFAIFALLITGIVSTFGGAEAEMVIKEVVKMADETCSSRNEMCFAPKGIYCCEGLLCVAPAIYPPVPGMCVGPELIKPKTKLQRCVNDGETCWPDNGIDCCEGLDCVVILRPLPRRGTCMKSLG